jgi:predicted nucleic acid-binding Zn ribbon protein
MYSAGRGWGERLTLGRLRNQWPAVVGASVAARSEPVKLAAGVLTIRAESGAWATELTLLAKQLLARMGDQLGAGVVRDVRVVVGHMPPAPR